MKLHRKLATLRSAFRLASRLTIVLALAWLGISTASSIKTLLASPSPRVEFPTIDAEIALLPIAGSWSFADSPVQASTTQQTELLTSLSEFRGELMIDEPSFKAVVQRNENSEATGAMLAVRTNNTWQTLKLDSTATRTAMPHLLPLDQSAQRVCGRWTEEQLLMEIVSMNADRKALLENWKQDGWEIQHAAWGDPKSFSFLCAKEGRVVYAWSKQMDQIQSLLMSSSPDVQLSNESGENS